VQVADKQNAVGVGRGLAEAAAGVQARVLHKVQVAVGGTEEGQLPGIKLAQGQPQGVLIER
jgi:hypothetical protein